MDKRGNHITMGHTAREAKLDSSKPNTCNRESDLASVQAKETLE